MLRKVPDQPAYSSISESLYVAGKLGVYSRSSAKDLRCTRVDTWSMSLIIKYKWSA